MSRQAFHFSVRLILGLGLLVVILRRVDLSAVNIGPAPPILLGVVLAAGLQVLGQCTAALRWKVIMGPGSPPWRYLARLYLVGGFFSLFLPTVVGGDVVRAAAAAQSTARTGSAVTSVLLDRLFGVSALLLYLLLGFLAAPQASAALLTGLQVRLPTATVVLGLSLVLAAAAAGLVVFRRSLRWHRLWDQARAAVRTLASCPRTVALALALGLVVQGLYLLLWIVLGHALAFEFPVTTYLVAVPLVTLGTMLPITLGGLGVREGVWLLLLRGSGIEPANVVAYSLLFFVANLLAGGVGGLLFVLRGTALHRRSPGPVTPNVKTASTADPAPPA